MTPRGNESPASHSVSPHKASLPPGVLPAGGSTRFQRTQLKATQDPQDFRRPSLLLKRLLSISWAIPAVLYYSSTLCQLQGFLEQRPDQETA